MLLLPISSLEVWICVCVCSLMAFLLPAPGTKGGLFCICVESTIKPPRTANAKVTRSTQSIGLHKIWLTQEADAKSWSGLKHVQPKEGRKELAPREIKFRYRRLDTTIRERAGSSQEGRKRAKDTPGYFLCFFFLFIPNSRCSRQKSSRHGRDESRQESSMGTVKGSPTIINRLFVGYGLQ